MKIEEGLRGRLIDGKLPCAAAFELATELGIAPIQVREKADNEGIHISRCQLGLFGFEEFGERRIACPLAKVPKRIEEKMKGGLVNGSLPCVKAWRIAREEGIAKFLVGSAAETLSLRIGPCQLGCF
ncbi:MAG TPA: hypothetical protein ENJ47_00960 [Candidatus Acetothermia bacterium]|nr:hypothetical protein [Candidatus Acetothermia bacterium]